MKCATIVQPLFRVEHPENDHHNESFPSSLFDATSKKSAAFFVQVDYFALPFHQALGLAQTNRQLRAEAFRAKRGCFAAHGRVTPMIVTADPLQAAPSWVKRCVASSQ